MKTFSVQSVLLASAAFGTLSVAQEQYEIVPDSVAQSTRDAWCLSQETQCPLICLQTPSNSAVPEFNQCNSTLLTYSCVCSDGNSPNITEYSQTLPFYICQEWGTQCVSNCGSDNACAYDCRANHPCGAQDPKRANSSIHSSTTSAPSSTASVPAGAVVNAEGTVYTGWGGAAATGNAANSQTGSSGAASLRVAALSAGQTFGTLTVIGALFGGFAIFL